MGQTLYIPPRYALVIAEKPRAAEKIALAIGSSPRKLRIWGVPIWIIYRSPIPSLPTPIVVASAAGHLYSLHTDESGYPVYNCEWVPRYVAEPKATHTKKFLEVLKLLCKKATLYVNACDYDIEGSLIGFLIIKFLGDLTKARRAKFSSLTPAEIRSAFSKLGPLDYEMAEAGECRHVLDWLWGINVSRALMSIFERYAGKRIVLSAGRVQTPTLIHAAEIDLERKLHVPTPLLYPRVRVAIGDATYTLDYDDEPFKSKNEAEEFLRKARSHAYAIVIDVQVKVERIRPPPPFNLPDLQSEAARILKLSPYITQKIAEDLYLDALISYPRTNSQKLPPTLDNKAILTKLCSYEPLSNLVKRLLIETKGILKPHNGVKDDPAHPAIYPTGEIPKKPLSSRHRKLYELIVRRYLATFSSDAMLRLVTITFSVAGRKFKLHALSIVKKGWYTYYPYSMPKEKVVPVLNKGMKVPIKRVSIVTKYTKPPTPLSRMHLVKWMEDNGIGTESTRAEIVETLYRRGYIVKRGSRAEVSDLGIAVAIILKKYVPELTSVMLTRRFEELIEAIRNRRISCTTVIENAKEVLSKYLVKLKNSEEIIAKEFGFFIENIRNEPKCLICNRMQFRDGLCYFHYEAYKRITQLFEQWRRCEYSWSEYLAKLIKLKSSGKYVREVANYLLVNKINIFRSFT